MLRQWPGTPVSEVPVKMLEFFAKICFAAVALLIVMSPGWDDCMYNFLACLYRPSHFVLCVPVSICLSAWAGRV
uniref:Uncharacterized protein n=1 Tax=Arundo donax TaxID=35708 RepID=A0A0A9AFS9_ARUDO